MLPELKVSAVICHDRVPRDMVAQGWRFGFWSCHRVPLTESFGSRCLRIGTARHYDGNAEVRSSQQNRAFSKYARKDSNLQPSVPKASAGSVGSHTLALEKTRESRFTKLAEV